MSSLRRTYMKRAAIVIVCLLLTGTATLISISFLKEDKIKAVLVTEINKHLKTEVSVGELDLSIIRSFPYASLVLHKAVMHPPKGAGNMPALLNAGKVILKFNLLNLISGKYTIHSIVIENATFSFFEDAYGRINYDIFNDSGSSEKNGDVKFNITRLTIRNSLSSYKNIKRKDDIAISIIDLVIKGTFDSELANLNLKGDLLNQKLRISNTQILPEGEAQTESVIEFDFDRKFLNFKRSILNFRDLTAEFSGKYEYKENGLVDIIFSNLTGNMSAIFQVIPSDIADTYKPYKPEGDLSLHGSIKGPASEPSSWRISATGKLNQAALVVESGKLKLQDIDADASFYYAGKVNSEVVSFKQFSGKTGSGKFKGSATIRNFSKPSGDFSISLNTNITEFDSLISNDYFTKPEGRIIADIRYKGPFTESSQLERNLSGEATLSEVGFLYNKKPVSEISGRVAINNNKVYFDGLVCKIGSSDLKANGFIDNLTGYFISGRKNVHANLNLFSYKLILEDILGLVSQESTSVQTSIFPPNITFNALLNVNSLTYKKLQTGEITGTFTLKDDILRGTQVSINALGGRISVDGLINGRYGNKAQIVTTADFKDVDINQLFYQFNEFGQNSLVSSNLKGTADASVDFSTSLFSDYTINTSTVEAIADIEIRNGELNDFEPLQAMSRFLDARELRNVKFSTLRNRIEITRKTVVIPRMEINSSALNLIGYGTHSFGNDIDYHVNMLLSDVLKAKRKKHDKVEEFVEDDGYGKPRLFLKLTGPVDDPVVRYDTKAVGKKIADDFKNEKQVLKDVIKKEFGRKTSEGTETTSPNKQSTEFQIEWDETK